MGAMSPSAFSILGIWPPADHPLHPESHQPDPQGAIATERPSQDSPGTLSSLSFLGNLVFYVLPSIPFQTGHAQRTRLSRHLAVLAK